MGGGGAWSRHGGPRGRASWGGDAGAARAAREAAGLSLSAMAARTHYSKPLLGMLETGRRQVKPEHVRAYAD
ncbi:helix-turn-helix domain-containing protein, partial [Nocardia cyriacigeorgica]|uniref:helix-turn-helix domain-containing protein n=1 Tax=Nocardia cyriacigeorgica TaxID=135487 RepID=UPI002455E210